jgi:hypothetical protein
MLGRLPQNRRPIPAISNHVRIVAQAVKALLTGSGSAAGYRDASWRLP